MPVSEKALDLVVPALEVNESDLERRVSPSNDDPLGDGGTCRFKNGPSVDIGDGMASI